MLFQLIKKDFLLTKKYWIVILIAGVALPVFIQSKLNFMLHGGFVPFFLSTLYIVFLLFSTVSMMEYKYKGAALLCTTPYTRKAIVLAKYLFIFAVFIGCYIMYTLTALFSPIKIDMLDISDIVQTFFAITVVFGILFPIQYRFGFEKSRYIFFFLVFLTPFLLPTIMKVLQNNRTELSVSLPFSQFILPFFLVLLALVIGGISLRTSIRIYSSQDL